MTQFGGEAPTKAALSQLRVVANFLTLGNEDAAEDLLARTLQKARDDAEARPAEQPANVWLCRVLLELARN